MQTSFGARGVALSAVFVALACSPVSTPSHRNQGSGGGGAGGAATASHAATGAGGLELDAGTAGAGGGPAPCTPGGPNDDVDGDGFTPMEGDCNDCDPNVNPNAVEVPTPEGGIPGDENCNGSIDEPPDLCDTGLDIADMDPLNAARAVDLCKLSSGPGDWGVVSAKWVMADGAPPPTTHPELENFHLGHGMLPAFGANVAVQRGKRMLALSSGSARQPTDPGYHNVDGFVKGYVGGQPDGFPKESPACPGVVTGAPNDPTGVEIVINTPSNAVGFSFDFDFFTFEWPDHVCEKYNDFFVALLSPIPAGQTDGNISFDAMGNPVSVNNAFLEVCGCAGNPPGVCAAGGKTYTCPLGDIDLIGTGFGFDANLGQDRGSTGWLKTRAPVAPNSQIVIRWADYDSGDAILDTTTLIDNWQWIAEAGASVPVVTIPK